MAKFTTAPLARADLDEIWNYISEADAAKFVVYERLCCPFFNFELAVETDANRLWVRLRGQTGIKEFIRNEFNIEE